MKTNLIIAIFIFAITSCSKDNETPNCPITVAGISGSYKITAWTFDSPGNPQVNMYNDIMEACERDDIYELKSDMNLIVTDAGTQCSPAGNETGTWSLSGNIIDINSTYGGEVQSFDCQNLVITAGANGFITTIRFTRQ